MSQKNLVFPPFVLDLTTDRLWRGDRSIELRPKTWRLMCYLAEHPGRLLTKDELIDAVWNDVEVTPGSLNQAIKELRQALDDDARDPRFIQTVHRRGFRFIAELEDPTPNEIATRRRPDDGHLPDSRLVGRETYLDHLHRLLGSARSGHRQVVFITGEAGIGKTSLLHEFLRGLEDADIHEPLYVSGGQCVEILGEGEAYLPVLDALDRLTRTTDAASPRDALRTYAPTWMVQLPWLMEADQGGLAAPVAGTPARMLREFCVAVEALATERPVVLWLEDLHWSDPATIDLFGALARRTEPARLLVVATYRPVDAAMQDHPIAPLKRALQQQGKCHELELELLDADGVATYLAGRFDNPDFGRTLSELVHENTDGNPLFVETMVNHLVAEGWVVRREPAGWELAGELESIHDCLPESLQAIVESQLDGMTPEEISTVEAASVAGEVFAAQAVAAALDVGVDSVEAVCGRLAGWGRILITAGTTRWPDGTAGQSYRFFHQVFRKILYDRMAPRLRQKLHGRLARGIEAAHAEFGDDHAAEIASHFERGGDPLRAIHHLKLAARAAQRRFAAREAVSYLQHALDLVDSQPALPDSPDRDRMELDLRDELSRALTRARGFAGEEQDANTLRELELGRHIGDVPSQLASLGHRTATQIAAGELDSVRDLAEESRVLATEVDDPVLKSHFRMAMGFEALYRGEIDRSRNENTICLETLDGVDPKTILEVFPVDFAAFALVNSGWSAWLGGQPDEARRLAGAACERAVTAAPTPFAIVVTTTIAMILEVFRRDMEGVEEHRKPIVENLDKFGIVFAPAHLAIAEGWWLVLDGDPDAGAARLHRGISEIQTNGSFLAGSLLFSSLAEAELARGRIADGLKAVDEAMGLVDRTGERFWEAEIHRLRGELSRLDGDDAAAETSFRKSLGVARRQGALSLELRAATSLAKLLHDKDRGTEARTTLSRVYDQFTEGFDTLDLVDAKALLESL
jgi:DNA-binding winged helix-turn-helix (wHTH) protein